MASPTGHGGRDHPDYGISGTAQGQALVLDMSELAVRLGSSNYFDRSGVQLFNETFQNGLQDWHITTLGTPAYVRLVANYVSHGGYAVEIENNGGVGDDAYMRHHIPYPYPSTMGFEFHVRHIVAGERFVFQVAMYTGTESLALILRIDSVNEELELLSGPATYTTIDISPYRSGLIGMFHAIKFTVNLDTRLYTRLAIDTVEYPVSNIPFHYYALVDQPHIRLYIGNWGSGDTADHIAVDNIIITLDEPG